MDHPLMADVADSGHVTVAQVVFAFARAVGMLPLTGTSSAEHMRQDLASVSFRLDQELIEAIEGLSSRR
jgi:diketogulonate reductase-like aldo/keto reductase